MNTFAVVVAIASTTVAIGCHFSMRSVEARLEFQDFPHKKWDSENPANEMKWNSKGEPVYIWESRSLEDYLKSKVMAYNIVSVVFGAIAALAWITIFGF